MKNRRWKIPITWKANVFIHAKDLSRAKEILLSTKDKLLNLEDVTFRINELELRQSYPQENTSESTNKRE